MMDSQDVHSRLELALQASNEGIWDWVDGQKNIYYSPRVLAFLGRGNTDVPSFVSEPEKLFKGEDLTLLKAGLDAIFDQKKAETLSVDCRCPQPDGKVRWLRIRGIAKRNKEGNVVRLVGSMIDISVRKGMEERLEEGRFLLENLIEKIPLNVYYKDKQSCFVYANTSTARKLGEQHVGDILGKNDHDFFDSEHADLARQTEVEIMESQKPQLNVLRRETWEGKKESWAETSKFPWLDKKGRVQGVFGVSMDVTPLMDMQRQLAEVADELSVRNRAFEEELLLAREIQQALMPTMPPSLDLVCGKFHLHSHYQSASEIAGDFLEIVPVSEKKYGVLLCDVMGHGVRSALVVSILRGMMERSKQRAQDPAGFLELLNSGLQSIFERANVTLFASALYLFVDGENKTLTLALAGHPAPLLASMRLVSQMDIPKGPALGLVKDVRYTNASLPLEVVDALFAFTDGIYEVESPSGEPMGIERLLDGLSEDVCDEQLIEKIMQKASKHAQKAHFDDDVCVFCLQREQSKEAFGQRFPK